MSRDQSLRKVTSRNTQHEIVYMHAHRFRMLHWAVHCKSGRLRHCHRQQFLCCTLHSGPDWTPRPPPPPPPPLALPHSLPLLPSSPSSHASPSWWALGRVWGPLLGWYGSSWQTWHGTGWSTEHVYIEGREEERQWIMVSIAYSLWQCAWLSCCSVIYYTTPTVRAVPTQATNLGYLVRERWETYVILWAMQHNIYRKVILDHRQMDSRVVHTNYYTLLCSTLVCTVCYRVQCELLNTNFSWRELSQCTIDEETRMHNSQNPPSPSRHTKENVCLCYGCSLRLARGIWLTSLPPFILEELY